MKKIFHLAMLFAGLTFFFTSTVNAQGASISSSGTQPDPSAMFDVSSTNKGTLMPRMNTVQRTNIVNPANGLTIFNTDCNVYNFNAGTPGAPNWVSINSANSLIAGVTIAPGMIGAVCAGTSQTFTATPANGITSPGYQWQVNGANVGTNSDTYTTSSLKSGDVVNCILTSNAACVTGSPATSNSITMIVTPALGTLGSISGSSIGCANTPGNIYSIRSVANATGYSWTVPSGASVTAGQGDTSITVTFGTASGNIAVSVVNSCGLNSETSDSVTVDSIPGVPGHITGATATTPDQSGAVYSVSSVAEAMTYTWTVPSDATITNGQGATSITVTFGVDNGNICVTSGNSCGTSSASCIADTDCYTPGSQTFNFAGGVQAFTVPECVNSITITCYGAQGGCPVDNTLGGYGGLAQGTLAVSPGNLLYVYVGGQNGWNGGGTGSSQGGNGGGESDVRMGGTAYSNWIIVAGGGGGGSGEEGSGSSGIQGGTGGGGNGCANGAGGGGGLHPAPNASYSSSGSPGTCTSGGAGGYSSEGESGGGGGGGLTSGGGGSGGGGYANGGGSGTQGVGGAYGSNTSCMCCGTSGNNGSGCGGGGGYYGGGGSSDGQCSPGGGGGGSSWAAGSLTNLTFTGGVQSGNGMVVVSW